MSRATFHRGRVGRYLADRYTRHRRQDVADDPLTPAVDESIDAWGNPVIIHVDPAPVPATTSIDLNVHCLWLDAGSVVQSMNGSFLLDTPLLYVASDDPLAIGDYVSDIVDAEGVLRLEGPARITDFTDHGPPGYTVFRGAKLAALVAA